MSKKVLFEDRNNEWEIWKKNSSIERSVKRVKKILPEMEASKQVSDIIKKRYKKGYKILDFGCAAGHFYQSLKRIDKDINYCGFDATRDYIHLQKNILKITKMLNLMCKVYFQCQKFIKKNSTLFFAQMFCIICHQLTFL